MEGYPAFQWSIFVKNGRDQQFVVRAEDVETFAARIKEAKMMIGEEVVNPAPVEPTQPKAEINNGAGIFCMTCKKPATQKSGISKKTGEQWNAIFCSSDIKAHTTWL